MFRGTRSYSIHVLLLLWISSGVLCFLPSNAQAVTPQNPEQPQTWVGSGEVMGQEYQFRIELEDSGGEREGRLVTNDKDILQLDKISINERQLSFELQHPQIGTLQIKMKRTKEKKLQLLNELDVASGKIVTQNKPVGKLRVVLSHPKSKSHLQSYVGEYRDPDGNQVSLRITDDIPCRLLLSDARTVKSLHLTPTHKNIFVSGIGKHASETYSAIYDLTGGRLEITSGKQTTSFAKVLPELKLSTNLIESHAKQLIKAKDIPSLSIGVVHGDKLVYAKAFGFADRENNIPATIETRYQIGSISKTMTATMMMQMVERKGWDLDDSIQQHLPLQAQLDKIEQPLSLRLLASHTSGLPRDSQTVRDIKSPTSSDLHAAMKETLLDQMPGTGHSYSNLAFMILGDAIASANEQSYENCFQSMIAQPLEMRNTTSNITAGVEKKLAVHYWNEDSPRVPRPCLNFGEIPGCGGVVSTVPDMAKYISFQLASRKTDTNVLSQKSALTMHEGQIPTGNRRNRIGVSWFSNTSSLEDTLVGHGGEVNGHSCNMLFSPTHDVGIIVMSNIGGDNIFPFSDWLVNQVINDYRNQMIPSIDEATDAVFAGRWSDAVWANRNILKHNKDDVEARHRLGVALFYLRRIAEAKQELEKIPDDQDNDGYAEMMLSRIAVIQGDSKGAIGHLDKAIINGFEDHYFVQNLSEFSILRDSKPFRDLMNRIN